MAQAFAGAGYLVLRYDLPFRRQRAKGPPFPAAAARDREGVAAAVAALRNLAPGRVFAGGHSYGGRQTAMAAAERPDLADALLLLSYPLHPPSQPETEAHRLLSRFAHSGAVRTRHCRPFRHARRVARGHRH